MSRRRVRRASSARGRPGALLGGMEGRWGEGEADAEHGVLDAGLGY